MQTWSVSYTADRKKVKNRNWLQGKMNYNPATNLAHFYDEDSIEIGKLKLRPNQIVPDTEISLWSHLIELGQLESTEEECVEDVFDRLNRELGIEEFDQKNKRQKLSEPETKKNASVKKIAPLPKMNKIPSKIESNEIVLLYDILYTRDKGPDRVWQDGLLKFHPNLNLGEFYEGDTGKLVHKKTMSEVKEGDVIEDACGGVLSIEICSLKSTPKDTKPQIFESDRLFSILYTTDKHKKTKKWLDGLLSYSPATSLAKFMEEESRVCFYKKMIPTGVHVGEEMVTGMYLVQIDHEITNGNCVDIASRTDANNENYNAKSTNRINIIGTGAKVVQNKVKSIVASESVPLEGRSNDELLALLNQSNGKTE